MPLLRFTLVLTLSLCLLRQTKRALPRQHNAGNVRASDWDDSCVGCKSMRLVQVQGMIPLQALKFVGSKTARLWAEEAETHPRDNEPRPVVLVLLGEDRDVAEIVQFIWRASECCQVDIFEGEEGTPYIAVPPGAAQRLEAYHDCYGDQARPSLTIDNAVKEHYGHRLN